MTVTPFRQPIRPGDKGLDVFAVRRALRKRGFTDLPKTGYLAGPVFVEAVCKVQHNNGLTADGVYGPAAHAVVAQSFDKYGVWLYTHAALRYVNPFRESSKLTAGRIDQGVDYFGLGPILAIGSGVVVGNGGSGWPGGHYLLYKLATGEHAGRYVYVAEAIIPIVTAGQKITAGQTVAHFGPDAAPGHYPGIETGWGSPTLNLTWAAYVGDTGRSAHSNSPSGLAFARLLRSLGVPLSADPGAGPTFPAPEV